MNDPFLESWWNNQPLSSLDIVVTLFIICIFVIVIVGWVVVNRSIKNEEYLAVLRRQSIDEAHAEIERYRSKGKRAIIVFEPLDRTNNFFLVCIKNEE